MAKMEALHLTPSERGELQSYLRKRNLPECGAAHADRVAAGGRDVVPRHRREVGSCAFDDLAVEAGL